MNSFIYHVKKFCGNETVFISRITPQWVSEFYGYLENGAGLAQTSAAHYAKILRAVLRKAVDENIISRNPCDTARRIHEPETELEFLNIDEVQRLADVKLDGGNAEIRRAFLFACHTGLRVSGLETLAWNKIETNLMQIAKQRVPLAETR
jgi:site-specific recombinase XerD